MYVHGALNVKQIIISLGTSLTSLEKWKLDCMRNFPGVYTQVEITLFNAHD